MIQSVNINQIFPRFILEDPDGYAMCKALKAGMDYFLEKAGEGLKIILDVDSMPEWRLDEMAWELNCLYDYSADVEIKRGWIRDAYKNYRIHGTAEGIRQYLNAYFDESVIQEYWEIEDGEPGQFNVLVSGTQTEENVEWIRRAVAKAKNVRSELNTIAFTGDDVESDLYYGTAVTGIEAEDWVTMIDDGIGLTVDDIQEMTVDAVQRCNVNMLQK